MLKIFAAVASTAALLIGPADAVSPEPTSINIAEGKPQASLKYTFRGNGRDQVQATFQSSGRSPLQVRLPAGTILTAPDQTLVITLRSLDAPVPPVTTLEADIPTAALSSKNAPARRDFTVSSDKEPRLQPLLQLLATRSEIPRATAQLAVLILLENIRFSAWQEFGGGKPSADQTRRDVVQAIDALGLLKEIKPDGAWALLQDNELKLRALRDPGTRPKALAIFGLGIPGDAPAPQSAPNLGQLLHTVEGDNCPVCRTRQKMNRGASDF